ncbi:hypothetical protein LNP74_31505 [Klebsiella pneumoniae subsp. pneumoniae]|nr:hypothetical protein [Klebsiella pneumoniae subsp. pneumoniae]
MAPSPGSPRRGIALRCGKDFLRQLAPLDEGDLQTATAAPGRSDPRQQAARGASAVRPASGVWFTKS